MSLPPLVVRAAVAGAVVAAGLVVAVAAGEWSTEREIADHVATVRRLAAAHPAPRPDAAALAALPAPVRRYLAFAVPEPVSARHVTLTAEGRFRRPRMTDFQPTTAEQTIALGTPALMFAATTPIVAGLWARAYDFFAEGRMAMRAKILSLVAVVDERETEALNQTSLRRWLIESPLYPAALLPGGPVGWEAIDDMSARATVTGFGLSASLVARFRPDGTLEAFSAEADGDPTTPYHGSGEYAERTDYRPVQGMMIPHGFTLARRIGGRIEPFWSGGLTTIRFE